MQKKIGDIKLTEQEESLTLDSKVMSDEEFMRQVELAKVQPDVALPCVMEGLRFLLLKLRRRYGWGLEQDIEGQLELMGVFAAVRQWQGTDRRHFAALAAWKVRGELWNEVRHDKKFHDYVVSDESSEEDQKLSDIAVVNGFYELDEQQTQLLAVRMLLQYLPQAQVIVVRALYLEGKEPYQVAREQHIHISSVYRRRDRGLANLHRLLSLPRRAA